MTFDQLRIFLAVAERLHVTRAAEALNLTQSAVSASIAALEAAHGVKLFDRVGRRIELTEAGSLLIGEARAILSRVESATMLLDDVAGEPRGRLRIHASQTVASYWLPAHLVQLHNRHPGIEIALTTGNTAQVAQAVQEGAADLGLVEGPVTQGDLHRQVVARDEMVLIMARDHPWAGRARLLAEDYRAQSWVLREEGSGTRSEFEGHLGRLGLALTDLDVALELPSNEAVLAAVAAGRSLSVLSRRAVGAAAIGGWVRLLPIEGPERPFALLTHPARRRTRAAQAMIDLMTTAR